MINPVNPFAETDETRARLLELQSQIDDMRITMQQLVAATGLLLRAENIRIDRAKKIEANNKV